MGYVSYIKTFPEGVIVNFSEDASDPEDRAFREEARKRGFDLVELNPTPKRDNREFVQEALEKAGLSYHLMTRNGRSRNEVQIISTGEAGTAYELLKELEDFMNELTDDGARANGTLFRMGEESGDVERFIISDNVITTDTAKLRFSDGSEYPF